MPQLLVRKVDEKRARKPEQRVGEDGVSMQEESRRILREALLGTSRKRPPLKERLLALPNVVSDADLTPDRDPGPEVEL
ncbi:MAG: DNA-binding protein [Limisphaerales bacterium]